MIGGMKGMFSFLFFSSLSFPPFMVGGAVRGIRRIALFFPPSSLIWLARIAAYFFVLHSVISAVYPGNNFPFSLFFFFPGFLT